MARVAGECEAYVQVGWVEGLCVLIETDFPLSLQANKGSSEMEKVALVSAASTQLQVRAERQQLVRASRLLLWLVWLLL